MPEPWAWVYAVFAKVKEGACAMTLKSTDTIGVLAVELAHISRRKETLKRELVTLDHRQMEIAMELNSSLGLVPLKEAAEKVKSLMEKYKEHGLKMKAESMRRLWASKTPEQRAEWKAKLKTAHLKWAEGRKRVAA